MAKSNGHLKLSKVTTGALIPQPHGGALRNGGTNNGGGSLPKVVREALLKSGYNRLPILEAIADDVDVKPEVRANVILNMVKTGLSTDAPQIAAAQIETPEGYKFSLVLGERGQPDD